MIGGDAPQFFILDSAPAAHFDPTTGVLVGDHLGTVNFIGQIRGLQTPTIPVAVTVQPTVIDQGTGAKDTIQAPLTQDTTVAPGSSPMPILVRGARRHERSGRGRSLRDHENARVEQRQAGGLHHERSRAGR